MEYLKIIDFELWSDYLWLVFIILAIGIVCGLIWRILVRTLSRSALAGHNLIQNVIRAIHVPGQILIWGFALSIGINNSILADNHKLLTASGILINLSLVIIIGESLFAIIAGYYLRTHQASEVPRIFEQLFKGLFYLIVTLSILSTSYKLDITPLLTTSAVFTMVIGLALQDVLGNFFSGLSVHISPPFRIGEWIQVGDYLGKVIESNWRATSVLTPDQTTVVLPNNDIAKKNILNISQYPGLLFMDIFLGLSYGDSPEKVRRVLLEACAQVPDILANPPAKVFMTSYDDFSIKYRVRFWFRDDVSHLSIKDQLMSRIWYRLKRDGMSIPFPIRDVNIHGEKDADSQLMTSRLSLIGQVDFLRELDRAHKVFLAAGLRESWFEKGETIVRKGAAGYDFFIIDKGSVAVYLDDHSDTPAAHLETGDFFGEMSLLTGEPRNATIRADRETLLLVIDKALMQRLLNENRELADLLSKAIDERNVKNRQLVEDRDERLKATTYREGSIEGLSRSNLLNRIRKFFRLV